MANNQSHIKFILYTYKKNQKQNHLTSLSNITLYSEWNMKNLKLYVQVWVFLLSCTVRLFKIVMDPTQNQYWKHYGRNAAGLFQEGLVFVQMSQWDWNGDRSALLHNLTSQHQFSGENSRQNRTKVDFVRSMPLIAARSWNQPIGIEKSIHYLIDKLISKE